MRLTFVQEDRSVIIDGEGYVFDAGVLEVIENLHAIQLYQDGYVEVEWSDGRGRAIGNSDGVNGLPDGFIDTLVVKHTEKKEEIRVQQEAIAEEIRLQQEAIAEAEEIDSEE